MSHTGFTTSDIRKILERDGDKCPICGRHATTANHRANRGAGGYRGANTLANGCAICDDCNGRIESDPELAQLARTRGVKLSRYDDPAAVPYLHPILGMFVLLDDAGNCRPV